MNAQLPLALVYLEELKTGRSGWAALDRERRRRAGGTWVAWPAPEPPGGLEAGGRIFQLVRPRLRDVLVVQSFYAVAERLAPEGRPAALRWTREPPYEVRYPGGNPTRRLT